MVFPRGRAARGHGRRPPRDGREGMDDRTMRERYRLDETDLRAVRDMLRRGYEGSPLWSMTPDGFMVLLPYTVFVCVAE